MRLNEVSDNARARSPRKRVGRGIGSGTGKTAARGHKGQKSRSGVSLLGFEGGQMPLYRRLPKGGFTNVFRKQYRVVNLARLQQAVDAGKLDAGSTVTEQALVDAGIVKSVRDGVRILAKGDLSAKLDLAVTGASRAAIEAIEKAGGSIKMAPVKEKKDRKSKKAKKSEVAGDDQDAGADRE